MSLIRPNTVRLDPLWLALAAVFSLCTRSPAAQQPADQPSRESAARLAHAYSHWQSVAYSARGTARDGSAVALRVVAHRDGRFRIEHFAQNRARGTSWEALPFYVASFNGTTLQCSRNEGGTYHDVPIDLWAAKPPGPVQMIFAPWLFLDRVVPRILADANAQFEHSAQRWSATSLDAAASISWDDTHALLAFARLADGPGFVQESRISAERGIPSVGSTLIESIRTGVIRDGQEVGAENRYRITAFQADPPDIDRLLAFDSVALQLNRFDPVTKNVYGPTGTLLYNEDAASTEPPAFLGSRTLLWTGIALLGTGSLALLWRRLRATRA